MLQLSRALSIIMMVFALLLEFVICFHVRIRSCFIMRNLDEFHWNESVKRGFGGGGGVEESQVHNKNQMCDLHRFLVATANCVMMRFFVSSPFIFHLQVKRSFSHVYMRSFSFVLTARFRTHQQVMSTQIHTRTHKIRAVFRYISLQHFHRFRSCHTYRTWS